jgi:hypothetical protein
MTREDSEGASCLAHWRASIRRALYVLSVLCVCFAVYSAVQRVGFKPDHPNAFVGSPACTQCHKTIVANWEQSLHHKMMRKADAPGTTLAQWGGAGAQPGFTRQDAVWVVGSKWEQQFMGHDGAHDTMLPGAWSVGLKSWTMQGWDGWQAPVPEQRCHGCHVVGLEKKTGHFIEAGIGCESCHGQGQWHMDASGHGPIYVELDSEVCGQCHTRGHATEGPFFFPVDYALGGALDSKFTEIKADFLQNSSQWWGNGRERDRHQEYPAWRRGGHANALKALVSGYDNRYGAVTGECLRCHSAEAAVHPGSQIAVADAKNGITCAVCHNVHGQLESIRVKCESCHDNGPFHHQNETLAQHVPCPASAGVSCAACHMPITVKVGGQFQLHSHAPGITPPEDGARFESPSSCANGGCHQTKSVPDLQRAFETFYRKTPKQEEQQVHQAP